MGLNNYVKYRTEENYFFSHIGDKIGRKTVMVITMVLMGFASIGIGLSPTYSKIGIWAPILMVLFRLIQGLAIGGELPSTIVFGTESIPNQRGLAMGVIFAVTIAGLLLGMVINSLIIHNLSISQINSFGWRIPFILGGLLCIVAYQIRNKLHETVAFKNLDHRDSLPIVELLKHHLPKIIIAIGLISTMATPIALALIFMPTYLVKIVKLDPRLIDNAILVATTLSIIATLCIGILADKINIFKLFKNLILLLIITATICYYMIYMQMNVMIAISIFAIVQGALVALPPILLSYIFPVHIRLSGIALSYNISFVIFAGFAPILITALIEQTHMTYLTPVLWVTLTVFIALIALTKSRIYIPKI